MKSNWIIKIALISITVANVITATSQNSPPVITNVNVEQRPDTKLVDITYDVSDIDGDLLQIEIQVSNDNGMTYSILPVSVSGDIHSGITPGTNKSIVWDAYPDYPDQLDSLCIFLIIARDHKGGISGSIFNEGYGDYLIVPEGAFQMGDPIYSTGQSDMKPAHYVYLDSFYIGKYELTNGEYAKFISEGGYSNEEYWAEGGFEFGWTEPYFWNDTFLKGGGIGGNENYPVIGVSWYEANAYCSWLSHKTGRFYRLPTEAEWEKAAKGSVHRRFPWSDPWSDQGGDLWDIDTTYANYQSYEPDPPTGRIKHYTLQAVGFYNGNSWTNDNSSPYGAYDMSGNVYEWCSDWNDWPLEWFDFGRYWSNSQYYHYCFTQGTVFNPAGPKYDTVLYQKVIRGGDFQEFIHELLSTDRRQMTPESRTYDFYILAGVGFRCVLEQSSKVESPSNIFVLDTRIMADFKQVIPGPSINHVVIPGNGSGYLYYDVSSDEAPLHTGDSIEFTVYKDGTSPVPSIARFLDKGLLRVDLSSSFFAAETAVYTLPEFIPVGDTLFYLNEPVPTFTAKRDPVVFTRTWDVFAGRSAGVSGIIGAGAGVSASVAKLSVSGSSGMGLKFKMDHRGNILIDRRFEAGISTQLEAPEVNFIVGDVDVGSAKITYKTLMGQSAQFSDLSISDTLKKMAQSGFLLETFSFAGLGLSPGTGIVLLATIHTINALSDMNTVFDDAMVETYWGVGAEGSFGMGLGISVGEEMGYKVADASFTGAMQAKYVSKHRKPATKGGLLNTALGDAGSSLELELAASYNLTLLPFEIEIIDGVSLGSDNFSLFSKGYAGSITLGADRNKNGDFTAFSIGLKGGGDENILGQKESTYYNSKLEFGQEHMSTLLLSSSSIGRFLSSSALIPLSPVSMTQDAALAFNEVVNAVGQFPIKVSSSEARGEPYDLTLGVEFDIAAGLGLGLSLGVTGKYLDEMEYPRKVSDVYLGGNNYMLTSSEYMPEMQQASLYNVVKELFSGTLPLIKTALQNFVSITEKLVEKSKNFVIEVYNIAEKKVGSIIGTAQGIGNWVIAAFSADTPRVSKKAFSAPEVKRIYYSSNVYHQSMNQADSNQLENAETLMFIVSEAMTIGFIPDGDTVSVDSLESTVELKMIISDQKLLDNDFTLDDKEKVNVYYYHKDSIGWILIGGMRDVDTVSAEIIKMGTYALGIELDISEDLTAPVISTRGTIPGLADDPTPEIYANISDNRFGSGIDLSGSHMILNGDTLDTYYDPTNEKLFYQVPDSNMLADGIHEVKILATDFAGNSSSETFSFTLEGTGTDIDDNLYPVSGFSVAQNYPNPFSVSTTIQYRLALAGDVEINIYDTRGAFIKQLFSGNLPSGEHSAIWNGTSSSGNRVSPGIYFFQVRTSHYNIVKKMQVVSHLNGK